MKQTTSMFKRIACAFLALVLAFGLLPVTAPHVHAAEATPKYTITFYKTNVRQHGDHVNFKYASVDNPSGGEKVTLKIVPTGEAGSAWFAIYAGLHDMDTDYSEKTPLLKYDVASMVGGFSSNWPAKGGMTYNRGDYTIVVFNEEDSFEPETYITFTVTREVASAEVLEPATCTEDGLQHEVYSDGKEADVYIPATGHNVAAWTPVDGTKTHTGVCQNDDCGEVTKPCKFDETHVCTVCGGAEESAEEPEEPEEMFVLSNQNGEKTKTFVIGEPIYVACPDASEGDWLSMYSQADGYGSGYPIWMYVSSEAANLYDGVWKDSSPYWNGMWLKAGTYELWLNDATGPVEFTLVEPADTSVKSLEIVDDTIVSGEKLQIKATNYSEYSWVGIYNGHYEEGSALPSSMHYYYCLGHNGLTMAYDLVPGEYTVIMFNDYDGNVIQERKFITVEGEKPVLLTTDKTEYKFGEPIMITSQLGNPNWIGLYKQDDANPTGAGPTSLFWVYPPVGEAVNLLSGEQQRHSEFVAGTYKVLLLDGSYNIVASVENIVITTEIDPSKTVTVPATCDDPGSITYYNTDGTVAKVEPIEALGHDYDSLRPEFDAENLQHTYICSNDNTHTKTENCAWDEGIEIEAPTAETDGKKEFTCTVCGGHRYEKISRKEVDREEITVQPKCETPGTKVVYYTDGTSEEVEIPKLNHDWNDWTFNAETKQHERTCKNDTACLDKADCAFTSSAVPGGTRYTCGTCQGQYEVIILSTDKTEYALGEPILVTVNPDVYDETATDWVGIWEENNTYTDGVSIYYHYPATLGYTANIFGGVYQRDSVGVGTYTIRLFAADDYDEITNLTIKVGPAVRDESKTVKVDPTCDTDGSITYYLTNGDIDEIITAEQDASLKATGHAYPETWTFVESNQTHTKVCANDAAHVLTENCSWDEGVETLSPTVETKGVMTYTCTVCGGTKTEEIPVLSATETGREVFAPTCEEQGYTLVTYSDGSTRKMDFVAALGHDFGGAYTRVEGSHTHSQECQRENCDEIEITDCELETNGVLSGDYYSYACTKCGEWEEYVIMTDKKVYATGEDIIITVHPKYAASMGSKDWIGLYHKGETPSGSGVTSIRWNYAPDFVDGMSIFLSSNHDRPEEDPNNILKAGEYTLFLCANDGYTVVARTTITVVTEEDPSKTVQVDPTCTEPGTITYYNTDGTVSRVVTEAEDENLKAHGHTFSDWSYDGIEKQSHTHICVCVACGENCAFSESKTCEWDEGVETLAPTTQATGIMTYTCTVCQGTREVVLPKVNVTVTGTETVEATCEQPGYIRTFYSDGNYSDEVIPAKGHAYGEWVYDAETKHHKQTCANDSTHVVSEPCTMEKLVVDNSVNYTCSICEGGYVTGLVETDKTVYGVTDPIMVTVHATQSGAWVGLYKEGEQYDPNNGGVASLFWTYITDDMVGKPFDITSMTATTTSGNRGEKLGNGKYVLVLFGDSGYTDVINRVEIEIFTDMSNTEFELLFYKAEVRPNGWHKRFQLKEVDNPKGGEKVSLGVNVTSGEAGSSWVGVFEGNFDLDTDFTGMTPILSRYVADIDGQTPFSLNWASKGGFDFYVGYFTVMIFADASTNYPVQYVTFEVYRPIVEGSEIILLEPSCEAPGTKMVDYEDDGKPETQDQGVIVIIPALGHDYGEWECIEGTNTHSKTCSREGCGTVVENCVFENGICTVCEGIEYHIHDLTKVSANAADCTNPGNIEYYTCECGKWFKDASATQEITDKNSVVIAAKGHSLTKVSAKAADCTNPGNIEYYTCECGKWFKDATATQEITDKNSVVISAAGHNWTPATCTEPRTCSVCQITDGTALGHKYGAWVFDADTKTHTHTCANNANHTETKACSFGEAEVIKEAVGNNKGIKKYTCTVCSGSYTEEFTAEATGTFDRIFGEDRYETSIAVAEQLKANLGLEKFQTIVVASGNEYADALSGTYLANQKNAPILLVRQQSMESIKKYIKNNLVPGGTVYILGGTKAVPASMESGLEGFNVKRLGGSDRYETNLLILKEAGVNRGDDILICTGKNFADTLSASAVNKAVLMVKDNLYGSQKNFLNSVRGGNIYIIGGKVAVSEKLAGELAAYGTVRRIDGATRYETSINVAKTFFGETSCAVLAYGNNFPDGLCGGALANSMNAPLILVTNDKYTAAEQYAEENNMNYGVVLGGAGLIKNAVAEKLFVNNK